MKVLQVLPALNSGGVEKGTLEIASALVEAGHESLVISKGGRLVQALEAQGSSHIQWDLGRKSPLTFVEIPKLRRWIQANTPDIIHVRSRMPAWVIYLAWKGLPKKTRPHLVSTVHGLHSVNRYSNIMNCGERVIVVSETLRNFQLDNYRVDPDKLRLVYRGVDEQQFPFGYQPESTWLDAWHKQYPNLAGNKVLTLPGRITRLKGHSDFIHLLKAVKEQGIPVKGLIVGEADEKHQSYKQSLEQQAASHGLATDLLFTGHRNDVKEIFSVSDVVFSLSTKPESFGRTTLEALSLGVPVVGYAHGGVGEILEALFPKGAAKLGDLDALTVKTCKILTEKPAVKPNKLFLLKEMKQKTLAVYQELLNSDVSESEAI